MGVPHRGILFDRGSPKKIHELGKVPLSSPLWGTLSFTQVASSQLR